MFFAKIYEQRFGLVSSESKRKNRYQSVNDRLKNNRANKNNNKKNTERERENTRNKIRPAKFLNTSVYRY